MESILLVDDRDGRVLTYAEGAEALRWLDEVEQEHPDATGALCLVRFDDGEGSVVGTGRAGGFGAPHG